jgi:multisubunit Na+/H+ antiporter MnhB subunit
MPIADWGACVQNGVATLACLPIVFQNVINALVIIAGIVAVFMIVWGGYKLVMSEGDSEKLASARKTLIYAIAGLIFVFLSFFFLNAIAQFTGVEQIAPR